MGHSKIEKRIGLWCIILCSAYQRAVLKQQMADKERLKVQHFSARVRESEEADELKRNAEEEEVKEVEQKKKQMRQFRDENKRVQTNFAYNYLI